MCHGTPNPIFVPGLSLSPKFALQLTRKRRDILPE